MKKVYGIFLLFMILALCPGIALAVDEPAEWEGVKFYLQGDYQYYVKGFKDRDINAYNGNADGQTLERERFFQHQLALKPQLVFVEGDEESGDMPYLTFNMRLDVGPYVFSSDNHNRLYTVRGTSVEEGDTDVAREDREKLQVKECYVQFINLNAGAFLLGRFFEWNEGLVWAIAVPPLPNWTFAFALNKANERKLVYFGKETDYKDRDDTNESMILAAYQNKDKGITLVLDDQFGWAGNHAFENLDTFTRFNNGVLKIDKGGLKVDARAGIVGGMVADLANMPLAEYLNLLNDNASLLGSLASVKYGETLTLPQTPVHKIVMGADRRQKFYGSIVASYNLGLVEPELGYGRCGGSDEWYQVAPYWGYDFEPKDYEQPRVMKTLLVREIEDRYWPLIQPLATVLYHNQEAYYFKRLSLTNLTFAKAGLTLHPTEKIEIFGQACKLWRTNVKFYEESYWDFFSVQYAFNNMYTYVNDQDTASTADDTTSLMVPIAFQRDSIQYHQEISDDLGKEFTGRITYKLFNGCDASLLGAVFKPGDFYKDVLTPKPYACMWIDANDPYMSAISASVGDIQGPNVDSEQFIPKDAWTVQFQLDFKWAYGNAAHPFKF
jgi:hypothetical protein